MIPFAAGLLTFAVAAKVKKALVNYIDETTSG